MSSAAQTNGGASVLRNKRVSEEVCGKVQTFDLRERCVQAAIKAKEGHSTKSI